MLHAGSYDLALEEGHIEGEYASVTHLGQQ